MIRWSGAGTGWWRITLLGVLAIGGCARPVVVSKESAVSATSPLQGTHQQLTETAPTLDAPSSARLDIREIKLIEDNGQQGLFVKLTGPPAAVTHYLLAQPTRLVIDITGGKGEAEASAQKYAVQNPLISEVRVARHEGTIRLTLALRGDATPAYTVNDLNDTVVAFLGEPTGGTRPVREQLVFTRRAVEQEQQQPLAEATPGLREARTTQPAAARAGSAPERKPRSKKEGGARVESSLVRKGYQGRHVSLDFKDADVHNVLRLLAEVSKLNIVATGDVRGKVTLRLFDVPWDQALDIVLQVLNLESVRDGNVIRISTVKRLREEREELRRAQEAAKSVEPLRVAYLHVNYAKATKLAEIISGAAAAALRLQSRGGQFGRTGRGEEEEEDGVLTRRGTVLVDEFTNTLIVRDIQRGVNNARELVRRLDVQAPQVLIESNIVEATTDFARDLGIQWGYRASVGPQTGNTTGVNFPGTIGVGGAGLGTGTGGVPFIADFPANGVVPGAGSALDLALGSLDGEHALNARLTALEKEGKARVISRPRVVTLNNVAATIKSLTIIRVKLPSTGTVINTGAGGAAGGQSTATEKIETGIVLVVTPQVSSDGFVLLDMFAKSSQADFTRTVDQIPTEISREANSHILVKDGQTIVLGGIYRENFNDQRTGIPFFKDIPGLGWLFRSLSRSNRREDLLVFLTPRIMTGVSPELPSAQDLWKNRNARTEG
ncbi:MAG: type IV pilus secretin PilQ [Candidatus Binatia bacterium]